MRLAGRAFSRRLFWDYDTAVEVQQTPIDAPLATRQLETAEIAFESQDLKLGAQPLHAAELELVAPGLGMALPTGLAELVIEPRPLEFPIPLHAAELVIEPRPLRAVLTLGVATFELAPQGFAVPLPLEPASLSFEAVPLYISTGEIILELAPAVMHLAAMPMAAVFINKQRVYEAICAAVAAANFYPVTYDPTNCTIAVADSALAVRPASVVLNEIVSTHRPAARHRRKLTFERDRWVWELILKFNQEVSVEDFEEKVLDAGLLIPADPSRNLPQIRVELEESPYEHPPQGAPANGTTVRFTLNARVHPK